MKRLIFRLSAFAAVVAVVLCAVAVAQRVMPPAQAQDLRPLRSRQAPADERTSRSRASGTGSSDPAEPGRFDPQDESIRPLSDENDSFPNADEALGGSSGDGRSSAQRDPFARAPDGLGSPHPRSQAEPAGATEVESAEVAAEASDVPLPAQAGASPAAQSGARKSPRASMRPSAPAAPARGTREQLEPAAQNRYAPGSTAAGPRPALPADTESQLNDEELSDSTALEGGARFQPDEDPAGSVQAGTGRPGSTQLEGLQAPSLTLEKTAPAEIQVGKPAVFTLRVRNAGSVAVQAVEVHDQVPQGTQLLSANPQPTQETGGDIVWAIGALKPGEEVAVEMELLPMTEGEIGSVATVHFAAEASVRTVCTRPELAIQVSTQPEVLIGEEIVLSIQVSNPGTGPATGIVLTESIPENLQHPAGPELEYEIGDLAPGETRQIDLPLKAVKAGAVVNVLLARGEGRLEAIQQTEIEVVAPELEVAMEGPKRRYLERQATYTVLIANPGTAPARDIELVTHLPRGLKFVAANNSGQYDPQTNSVHWLLEELPANQIGSVKLTTLPIEAGEQTLRVEGSAERGLTVQKEEVILIEGVAALLFQVLDVSDPIEVGGETAYEIRVVNQGSKAANNIELTVSLPDEMEPAAAEGPTRYEISGRQVLFEPLPLLAPKADTTYRVRVKGLQPGDLRVSVQLASDELQTPVTKEESTHVFADE